ncbi:MAG: serine hydrolase domain-containing protein [bacterium]
MSDSFSRPDSASETVPLPAQQQGVPWPVGRWPVGALESENPAGTHKYLEQAFSLRAGEGVTYALVIIQRGRLVFERYDHGANEGYLQYSWSMAKSFVHALVGLLVMDTKIAIHQPIPVPEWQRQDDPRRRITWHDMLRMRDGLDFVEDYIDDGVSDVINMLFGAGRGDVGTYAARCQAKYSPGEQFNYSSGTTNIICRALADIVGNGPSGMLQFMEQRLFGPLGMRSPTPKFDAAGTFIGSSYLLATPQDFARFGLLYLRGGLWNGQRILPSSWVDYARTLTYQDPEQGYGAHWWVYPDRPGWFYASGYDGQRILLVPEKDLVIVRCGRTDAEHAPAIWANIDRLVETLA